MNKKVKILYTIPNFDTAGSGKVLYDLVKGLNKDKFDITIVCKHSRGHFFTEIESLGVPIYILEFTKPLKPYYSVFFRIQPFCDFIKQHQFQVIHSWNWSSDWSEVLAARKSGVKYVYTKKAMTWGNIHWKIKSYLADFIITINQDMKNFFPYKKNQMLIPLGLDTNYYNPNLFPKKSENSVFKIITVANLVKIKGLEVLIEAIAKLDNPKIHLDIIGEKRIEVFSDGTEYHYDEVLYKLVAELNLENQVHFLGNQTDVRPFLAQADLYVIPSKKEGMPMALLEAMTMGVSVLGSNIPGINYVLNNFQNLLFEEGNSNQLAQKIEQFYCKSAADRETLGNELRQYCIENFTVQNFVSKNEEIYLKMLHDAK